MREAHYNKYIFWLFIQISTLFGVARSGMRAGWRLCAQAAHKRKSHGGLYAMGCALASVGANLEPGVDLRQQLEPMLAGYQAMRESQVKAQAH